LIHLKSESNGAKSDPLRQWDEKIGKCFTKSKNSLEMDHARTAKHFRRCFSGIAPTPEASEHTSVKARVEHVKTSGRTEDLKAAERGSVTAMRVSSGHEDDLWLVPIQDRR
jgi:formate dehydrogenase maturation protein FdhE